MLMLSRSYILYASAIFLSAFLLFQIQPIAGKHMLPYFGGSSSVWATSLLFFTGMLFFGYLYAYLLCRLPEKKQVLVHFTVVMCATLASLAMLLAWRSLFPTMEWTIASLLSPWLQLLFALAFSIGLPYFLLSTTGPLLQYWYGITEKREPYKLYALSNIGSFLALGSYPFLVEPNSTVPVQDGIWLGLFLVYAALAALVCNRFFRSQRDIPTYKSDLSTDKSDLYVEVGTISRGRKVAWVVLAALPSFLLVATTTQITQLVAPLPLLWIVPLSLYLVTYILAFSGYGRGVFTWFLLLAFAIAAYEYHGTGYAESTWRVISDTLLLFFCGLYCHAQLYANRPDTRSSSLFYLCLSFGGMIGALLASVVAPLIFPDLWEFPIGIALAALVAITFVPSSLASRIQPGYLRATKILLLCSILVAAYSLVSEGDEREVLVRYRNFYGTALVYQTPELKVLLNGGTIHGVQMRDAHFEFIGATYFSARSGIARAIMDRYLAHPDRTLNIGITGLGAGAISAYCGSGDTYVYYEIDPSIEKVAREHFSYLSRCKGVEVRTGDARILLEQERRRGETNDFDVLAMDAFNDDTIPVHLITKEAIQLYLEHIQEDGIIAINTSNRLLDIAPVIVSTAEELGLSWLIVITDGSDDITEWPSEWVLLSKNPDTFKSDTFTNLPRRIPESRPRPWTDDYSDILSVLLLPAVMDSLSGFLNFSD